MKKEENQDLFKTIFYNFILGRKRSGKIISVYLPNTGNNVIIRLLNQKVEEVDDMDFITVRELYRNKSEYLNKEITVGGWVRSIRDSKTFGFIVVNDGSFFESLQRKDR